MQHRAMFAGGNCRVVYPPFAKRTMYPDTMEAFMPLQGRKLKQLHPRTIGGAKLQELRNVAGLSLLDLAAKLDSELGKHSDAAHINKIETGSIKKPTAETLEAILVGLGASYRDRRGVLEAFGYQMPMTLPTEREIAEVVSQSADELRDATYPVCLLDFGQRLWAWNRFAPRLIGLHPDDLATRHFLGVSTVDLIFNPAFETRLLVANPEQYFPGQIHNIKVGIEPLREQPGYRELVAQWSSFPGFIELWNGVSADMIRSVVPMKVNVPSRGMLQFRTYNAIFEADPRFELLHFTPYGAQTLRVCAEWAEEEGVL
jgi:transcriptional regulator with XRE-family HTH domain